MMNKGQKVFLEFIEQRVQDEKQSELKELLKESYGKQKDGTFDPEYLAIIIPKLVTMLKLEYVNMLKQTLEQYGE